VKMNKMLNRFHMWFPGGIFLGSLVSKFMTDAGLPWEAQIWVIMIPTVIYVFLFFGQTFPKAHEEASTSIAQNFKAMLTPLYLFIFVFMFLTAITEFGPQQWVGVIMSKSGASPMLILALTTALMAVGRYFAGPLVHKIDQTGVLLGSALFATIGIYLFSTQTGAMAYVAAIFFAVGVCYFWPTMIGFVAQNVPLSGALGMSIIGGAGMFSSFLFQPIIGRWIDGERAAKTAAGLTGEAMELAAGQATLLKMTAFPIILVIAFTVLFFVMRRRKATAETEAKVLQQPVL
jgi:MFS transporter, putative metabolite:H+ symporter